MSRPTIILIPLLSILAWGLREEPEKQVLNLHASGHVHVAGLQHQKHGAPTPEKQEVASKLSQLAPPVLPPVILPADVIAAEAEPTDADIKNEAVSKDGVEYVTEKQCEGAVDVLSSLIKQERHVEVFLGIGGFLAFLIALVSVSIWVGTRVKPPPPRYWNNGGHCCCSFSNEFDAEFDVTDQLLPVVQKLVDMTTIPELLGVGHDASWQTHKRFKVTKVMRIESGRHWTQYASALKVTAPYAESLKECPKELREVTEERWTKLRKDHEEREKDPVVGPFLKKLKLDKSRNEMMLFHGSPLAGARNGKGEIIFPTEAQAPMNAIKKTGFDERLGNTKGMLGSGTYFGDHITKADSYAGRYHEWPDGKDPGSVGEVAAMFLARVAVGCPYMTSQSLEQLRRPPCLQGHFDATLMAAEVNYGKPWKEKGMPLEVCEHQRFDSVIADPPMTDGHPWATDFREYVLYEKRCYPEYLFYYERLDAE